MADDQLRAIELGTRATTPDSVEEATGEGEDGESPDLPEFGESRDALSGSPLDFASAPRTQEAPCAVGAPEMHKADDANGRNEDLEAGEPAQQHHAQSWIDHRRSIKPPSGFQVPQPVTLSWRDIKYSVKVRDRETKQVRDKVLLNGVSGYVRPGQLLFIMGPSGSGKSTLLDLVADRIESGTKIGEVCVNGRRQDDTFRDISGYVQQHDALMGVLTVRESLRFAAEIAGESDPRALEAAVHTVASNLGLQGCLDRKIGNILIRGISDGQRRRMSLGVELLRRPALLLCDEVTTGLDSAAAYGVMLHLRALANAGLAVAATVHQPPSAVWALADKLLLLWRGRTVYFGDTDGVAAHFAAAGHPFPARANPADYLLDLINDDFEGRRADGATLVAFYSESEVWRHENATLSECSVPADPSTPKVVRPKGVSLAQQCRILAGRHVKNYVRNPGMVWIRLAMYAMLALMAATQFWDIKATPNSVLQRQGLLFYLQAFMVFMSVSVLPFFGEIKAVYLRERSNGHYAPGPYALSSFIVAVPAVFLIAAAASLIVYFAIGLSSGGFATFLLVMFASLLIAEGVVYCAGALAPVDLIGIAGCAFVFGAFMLVEGLFKTRDQMKWYFLWLHYIAFHTYSYRIFVRNEFEGLDLDPSPFALYGNGDEVVRGMGMAGASYAGDFVVLGVNVCLFFTFYYLILKYKHTGRR